MYSTKKNILETIALLKAYQIDQIVISPGSRNAPLIQSFTTDNFFKCHTIVDERNAGFYALGIIQKLQKPVVICCTSGSALLNYAPAVSEAYYQQLSLIVISADRSAEWIGQMDGQTIPQFNVFGDLSRKSVNLPEVKTESERWYCNRLLNDALIASTHTINGPVHINIPISEPLFDYSEKELPSVRKITLNSTKKLLEIKPLVREWCLSPRRLIIVGQSAYSDKLVALLESLIKKSNCVIFVEHLSNAPSNLFINKQDIILASLSDTEKVEYAPDLVITLGGHIVSKRLKHFLRNNKPKKHWHISPNGELVDLFQSLTNIIETNEQEFLTELCESVDYESEKPYLYLWNKVTKTITEPSLDLDFSDILVTGTFLKKLPKYANLHLANSSIVRNAQLYNIDQTIQIFCNRGVNGIDSSLPSTVGFASVATSELVYLLIGDLSFFYGLNSLWNIKEIKNLRILLINNNGGGIFNLLPGLDKSSSLRKHVMAEHGTSAERWAEAASLKYMSATNKKELNSSLEPFINKRIEQPILLEVFTCAETNKEISETYYSKFKKLL